MRPIPLALLIGLLPAAGLANDSEFYGGGADVYPVRNDQIAMAEETLVIEQLGPNRAGYVNQWLVSVRYVFHNTSAAPTTVQMGFPEHCQRTVDDMEVESPSCKEPAIKDFSAIVDGTPAKVTVKTPTAAGALPDAGFDRVHTFEVKFKPGERKVVEHRYHHRGRIVSPYHSGIDYILKTGGLWKGPIGKLDLRIVLKSEWASIDDETKALPPPGFQGWEGGTYQLRWQLVDFEPKGDIGFLLQEPKLHDAYEALRQTRFAIEEDPKVLTAMSAEALRILRNTPHALLGYTFKDKALAAHFAKVPGYRPRADFDPKWLNADELDLIRQVKAEEARRKAAPKP